MSFNGEILVSTSGGIYTVNDNLYYLHNDDLTIFDISTLEKENNRLWIGSNTNGSIQVLNENFRLIKNISYPLFDKINDIAFSNEHAYVIVENNNENVIARYLKNNMQYLDIIDLTDAKINDIKIDENNVYVLTDAGYFIGNHSSNNLLSMNQNWDGPYYDNYNVLLYDDLSEIFIVSDGNSYYTINNNQVKSIDNLDDVLIDIYNIQGDLLLLTSTSLYAFDAFLDIQILYSQESIGFEHLNNFTSYTFLDEIHYFGLKNNGILMLDNSINPELLIPNTIYKNQFDAIQYTNNGKLIGVANHGVISNELSGGFVIENVLIDDTYYEKINNFYSWPSNVINKYPISQSYYKVDVLNYWFGGKTAYSIVSSEDEIYFSNSGVFNDIDVNSSCDCNPMEFYDYWAQVYSFYNNPTYDELQYGGVVSLNIDNSNNLTLGQVWNMNGVILDGNNGILDTSDDGKKPYMTVNQINFDKHNNLYVVNPNSETHNWSIVVKPHYQSIIRHIYNDPTYDNAYLPTEIAFDKHNNIWVGYLYHELVSNEIYSSGGIRMIEVNNFNEEDFLWHNYTAGQFSSELSEDLFHTDIFSIDIGADNFGNDILWVLTNKGAQGYIMYSSYTNSGSYLVDFQKINNDFYFSNLSFEEGNKIRVDMQNNAWITTSDNGLFLIKNDGNTWSYNGSNAIDFNNFNLLSDIIYDIDFDYDGNVFVATELGISILETSFARDESPSNISVSPNPFKIGQDNKIIFTNIPKESTVKIMNLSGLIVKEFYISNEDRIINWDGVSKYGKYLETGVYLVSIYNHNNGDVGVTKLAIIK